MSRMKDRLRTGELYDPNDDAITADQPMISLMRIDGRNYS